MEQIEVRRVRPDEWEALRDLRLRALATDPDAFGDTHERAVTDDESIWRARADRPDGTTFVAVAVGGRMVGMAGGGPAPHRADVAAVYGMWVAPEARGQGLGGQLLSAIEDWARNARYELIGLGVTTTNEPAIRLYTHRGYADIGDRHELREGADLSIQIMTKRLGPASTSPDR